MIMVITIIYHWTDDEPSISTADKDKEPEPDLDKNRTDLENRERRDDTESQDRMPTREDIEMESKVETMNKDLDFLQRLNNPSDPAHVQSSNLKYNQAFITFPHSVGPWRPIVKLPKIQKGTLFKPTDMMTGWNILHRMMPCSNELLYLSVLFITINKDPVLSSPYSLCDFFF